MRTHRACDALLIANFHEMLLTVECVPDLQSFWQQWRWIVEANDLKLQDQISSTQRHAVWDRYSFFAYLDCVFWNDQLSSIH